MNEHLIVKLGFSKETEPAYNESLRSCLSSIEGYSHSQFDFVKMGILTRIVAFLSILSKTSGTDVQSTLNRAKACFNQESKKYAEAVAGVLLSIGDSPTRKNIDDVFSNMCQFFEDIIMKQLLTEQSINQMEGKALKVWLYS
jgi:hypothetical protein